MAKNVINLNKARKTCARTERREQADENAVKFGRTKAERVLNTAKENKVRAALDGHKFDDTE